MSVFDKLFGIGDLSPEKFTALVARTGIKSGRLVNPEVDEAEMRIKSGSMVMLLGNAYRQFLALPRRERQRFISETVLRPEPEIPTTWEQCADKLIANVRCGAYIATAAAQTRAMGAKNVSYIAHREVGPDLFATIAIDLPTTSIPVTTTMLAEWGKTFDQAYELGIKKLASTGLRFAGTDEGFYFAAPLEGEDDTYLAARILMPQIFESICPNPYVAIPSRNKIFVGDPTKPGMYSIIAAMADNPDDSHRVSSRVFQVVDGKLREATPPPGEESAALAALIEDDIDGAYGRERHLWDQLSEPEEFCAKYMRYKGPNGQILRLATWTQAVDVPTLLPEVDLVSCVLGDPPLGPTFIIPLKALIAKCSLTRTDSPLPRWIAHPGQYPSREWLEANEHKLDPTN